MCTRCVARVCGIVFLKNATVFMNSDSLVYLYKQKKTEH